jgi:hypothetical protein
MSGFRCRISTSDGLVWVDNGLFVIPIADVRGNVCLSELPSAEVGQKRSVSSLHKLLVSGLSSLIPKVSCVSPRIITKRVHYKMWLR